MLCLTRIPLEAIQISSDITITVLSVSGNQVSFGIDAPASMVVLREELHDRMARGDWRNPEGEAGQEPVVSVVDVEEKPAKPKPKITYKRRLSRLKTNQA
jgi:carbon storage regulator CsrA